MDFDNYIEKILPDSFDRNKSRICVYGLGTTGRLFIDLCIANNISVDAVYVGKEYHACDFYSGIRILDIENIENEEMILLYSIKQKIDKKISEVIKKKDKITIVDISSVEIYQRLMEIYYNDLFGMKKIQLEKDHKIIDCTGCKIINSRNGRYKDVVSWPDVLQELGDIIFPGIYDDYSRIDEGSYEYGQIKVASGDTVIDVGAHIGIFSAFAAYRGGVVHAFEPIKDIYDCLLDLCKEYPENIIPVNMALYNENTEKDIYKSENKMGNWFSKEADGEKEKIQCIKLDEYVRNNDIEKVDYIKADIEGSEGAMLEGARETLRKFAPKLAICTYHNPNDKEDLTKIILDANPDYIIEYKWKKLYAYVPDNESIKKDDGH